MSNITLGETAISSKPTRATLKTGCNTETVSLSKMEVTKEEVHGKRERELNGMALEKHCRFQLRSKAC